MVEKLLISEAFEKYRLEYIVYRNQSAKTEEMSVYAMKSLIAYIGDIPIENLTFDQIRKWKTELERARSQNTVRGYIIKLRVVLTHMKRSGLGVIDPDLVGIPKKVNTVVDFLTEQEVTSLIEVALKPVSGYSLFNRQRNAALLSLLYASGIRVSELRQLDRSNINWQDLTFTVIGKGNKPRLCFLDGRAASYIRKYLSMREDLHPALFTSDKTGDRISVSIIQQIFRNLGKKAEMTKPLHPHIMRHSYATNLLRNNTNLLYVRDFLGHESIQTTEMYTHVVNEDLRKIYMEKHTI